MMSMDSENKLEERSTAEIFTEYASLLWHWAWLLILLALIAGVTAYFVSRRGVPVYKATTLIMINGAPGVQSDSYSSLYLSQQLAVTYAQTMTTKPMLEAVSKKLGLDSLPGEISVQTVSNTSLMRISVTGPDPDWAALIANTVYTVFAEQVQSDQAARYADSKKSLEDQMDSINQQIQSTTGDLTAISQKIQEIQNPLDLVNQQIQDTQNSLNSINDKINAVIMKSGESAVSIVDLNTRAQSENELSQLQSQQSQYQQSLLQYQPQQTQLQTALTQYQNSYYYLLQSYEQVKLAEAQSTSIVVQKDPASPNRVPIQPQPVRSALLAAVVGLMVAAGIVFLIEFLDDTIRDPQEITRKWGVPVLGTIVTFNSGKDGGLITAKQPRAPVSEAFRSLRANLQFASIDIPVHSFLVTSASPEDGKTTVAANLASVIAQSGREVVAVDTDLRRPKLHKVFQLSNRLGLTNQFIQTSDLFDGTIKNTQIANLHVITSGNLPPNPSELLGSGRMIEILRQLTSQFNTVILDTPPMLAVSDALVLAPFVDGVLLVVKPTVTKRVALKRVIEELQQVKANLLGVVLNDVKVNHSRYYYYRGYEYHRKYGKGYQYYPSGSSGTVVEAQVINPNGNKPQMSKLKSLLSDTDKRQLP
jgi:succinoglycan biosynthesis transport protein ExoP